MKTTKVIKKTIETIKDVYNCDFCGKEMEELEYINDECIIMVDCCEHEQHLCHTCKIKSVGNESFCIKCYKKYKLEFDLQYLDILAKFIKEVRKLEIEQISKYNIPWTPFISTGQFEYIQDNNIGYPDNIPDKFIPKTKTQYIKETNKEVDEYINEWKQEINMDLNYKFKELKKKKK